jgi:thiamine-monophosphate kinase
MSDEFTRIARYFAPLAGEEGLGLANDAAVLKPPPGRELVLTVDQMLEGVHFLSGDDPSLIARKLLRRNLSDLAAMGAVPMGYLLTTALPTGLEEDWLAGFSAGLAEDQKIYGISLYGGDSSSTRRDISLSATLIGHVAPGAALSRGGAKPGDEIWVTGIIGDAALGLKARRGELTDPTGYLTRRSLLPDPRVGLDLAGIVSAAIDVSDGLLQDLGHICRQSGVGAVITADDVPVSQQAAAFGPDMLEARLTDGDDYELVVTVPPERVAAFKFACGALPVTRIGRIVGGEGVEVRDRVGGILRFGKAGWRHF